MMSRVRLGALLRPSLLPRVRFGASSASDTDPATAPLSLFKMIDKDNNGSICRAEYDAAIDSLDEAQLRFTAKKSFDVIDINADGVISEHEFKEALGFYTHSELARLRNHFTYNELSRTPHLRDEDNEYPPMTSLLKRFVVTFEVAVSKILPGGMGWQAASIACGSQPDTMSFALSTGVGDAIGVAAGHFTYMVLKKTVTGSETISVKQEADTALWLGTACIFSGSAWQPAVNLFHSAGVEFTPALGLTAVVCGFMFFSGLRCGRMLYAPFTTVEAADYGNLQADAALSMSVGGATGCFVGTDTGFVPDGNWLRPVFGIETGMADLQQCLTAGSSTAVGFASVQATQNLVLPAGRCWVD